jgi:hypothetical protein
MSVSGKIELVFFRRQARCSSILLHNWIVLAAICELALWWLLCFSAR